MPQAAALLNAWQGLDIACVGANWTLMLMACTGHACSIHHFFFHATPSSRCIPLHRHTLPCERTQCQGPVSTSSTYAGPISVLEEGCGAIPVEFPGSQNLLRAGCGCTGYDSQPIALLLMNSIALLEVGGLVNTLFPSCCMAPITTVMLMMPAASCLCMLLSDVSCWLGLTLPTSARRRREKLTCCEAELICSYVYLCVYWVSRNAIA